MITALLKSSVSNTDGCPMIEEEPATAGAMVPPFARLPRGGTLRFVFEYLGIPFEGEVRHRGAEATIGLRGNLGPIPYSAESTAARREVLTALAAAHDFTYGRFTTTADKCILLDADLATRIPVTPECFLSGLTRILVAATPLLARLATLIPPVEDSA